MQKRRLFHIPMLFAMLAMLFASNVFSSKALSVQAGIQNQLPNKLNLLIMVRAARSTSGQLGSESTKTKLQIIQDVTASVIKEYPFPSNVDIGVMAFGHRVDKSNFDASCSADNIELVAPFTSQSNIDLNIFTSINGLGESPTALAIQEADKYFTQPDALNIILLIADGADTCRQNPEEQAKVLREKNIQIYTLGLRVNPETGAELENVAGSPDRYYNVPTFVSTEGRVKQELTTQINLWIGQFISQISTPPAATDTSIPSTETNTPISASVTPSLTPQPTITPSIVIIPTELPATESATETWAQWGMIIVGVITLTVVLIIGFILLNSRPRSTNRRMSKDAVNSKAQPTNEQRTEQNNVRVDTSSIDLDVFLQDTYKAYSTFGNGGRYVSLDLLKKKLSNKYFDDQFDKILILARQKYPNNIWVDKDSRGQQIVKIVR